MAILGDGDAAAELVGDGALGGGVGEGGYSGEVLGGDGGGGCGGRASFSGLQETGGVFGAELDGHVTAETRGGALAVVGAQLLGHLELALGALFLSLQLENRAVGEETGGVGALLDGVAEDVFRPAILEVTVVAVASGVTVGEHESTRQALEVVGLPDGLEEQRRNALVETLRAHTTVDEVRVGDVGLVVVRVVLAVPARREED